MAMAYSQRTRDRTLHLGGAALAAAALVLTPLAFGGSQIAYATLTTIAIFAVMCYGVDIVLSYLGEVSLGHTLFLAVGGYITASLATRYGLNGWETLAATILGSALLALFIGLTTLRTYGFVFSLVTYASAVVAMEIASNWNAVGASDGIVGLPLLTLPLGLTTFTAQTPADLWLVACAMLFATIWLVWRFRLSRLGTAAMMVHLNPSLASCLGTDANRVRLATFVLSAPVTATAGWLYAYQRSYVGPDLFDGHFLIIMLAAIIVVGRRVLFGPLIGAAIIVVQQDIFSLGGDWNKVILGSLLALTLILLPDGLSGIVRLALGRFVRSGRPAELQSQTK